MSTDATVLPTGGGDAGGGGPGPKPAVAAPIRGPAAQALEAASFDRSLHASHDDEGKGDVHVVERADDADAGGGEGDSGSHRALAPAAVETGMHRDQPTVADADGAVSPTVGTDGAMVTAARIALGQVTMAQARAMVDTAAPAPVVVAVTDVLCMLLGQAPSWKLGQYALQSRRFLSGFLKLLPTSIRPETRKEAAAAIVKDNLCERAFTHGDQIVITFLQWAAVMVGAPLGPLRENLFGLAHRGEHDPSMRQADLLSAACVALVQLPPRDLRRCWRSRHHKLATPLLALSTALCSLMEVPSNIEEAEKLTGNPAVIKLLVHRSSARVPQSALNHARHVALEHNVRLLLTSGHPARAALAKWVLAMVWREDDDEAFGGSSPSHGYGTALRVGAHMEGEGRSHDDTQGRGVAANAVHRVSRHLELARGCLITCESTGFARVFSQEFTEAELRAPHPLQKPIPTWSVALAFAVCSFYDVAPTMRNANNIVAHVAFCRAAVDLDPTVMDPNLLRAVGAAIKERGVVGLCADEGRPTACRVLAYWVCAMTGLRVTTPPPTASKTFSFKRRSVCGPEVAAAMAFIGHDDESPTHNDAAVGSKRYTNEPSPSHRGSDGHNGNTRRSIGKTQSGASTTFVVGGRFGGGVRGPVPLEDAHSSSDEGSDDGSDGSATERKSPAYVQGREPPNAVNSPRFHAHNGARAGIGAEGAAGADAGSGERERKSPQQAEAAAGHRSSRHGSASESKHSSRGESSEPRWSQAPLPPKASERGREASIERRSKAVAGTAHAAYVAAHNHRRRSFASMVSDVDGFDASADASFLAFEEFCGLDFGADEGFVEAMFSPAVTPVPSRRNTRYSAATERSIMSGRPTLASSAAEAAAAALEAKDAESGAGPGAGGTAFRVGRNGATMTRRRRSRSRGRTKPKRAPADSLSLSDLAGSSLRTRQSRRRSGNMRGNNRRHRR